MIPATLRRTYRSALLALGLSFAWTVPSAAAESSLAAPKVTSGEMVRLRGQWMTQARAAELSLPGNARIALQSTTDASVLTEPQSLMLLPGKKLPTYSVILRKGMVEVEVPEAENSRVAIAVGTPSDLRVVTLSGRCSVKVDGHKLSVVSSHGLTTIAQGSKLVRLPIGIKRIYQGQSVFVDQPLLEATAWVGGRRVWVNSTGRELLLSGYTWAPVKNASSYLVTLRDPTRSSALAHARVSSPASQTLSTPVDPGRYELSVAAIDGDGFVSTHLAKVPITVVGVELPGGAAILPNNTVVIAPEQQLRLTFAEGLTLTTADHRNGISATEPFGLQGLDRAVILIHPPGGGETSALTLVRRLPLVSAWVGPKLAIWPDDSVALQVSFIDALGRPTPRSIEPSVKVYVGVEPVAVDWEKHEDLWQAKLPPVHGSGPWVIRLEVTDQHGAIIGRDFAEIAKARVRLRLDDLDPKAVATNPSALTAAPR